MIPSHNLIEEYVERRYISLGLNKRREIVRLIFEIVKRDKIGVHDYFKSLPEDLTEYKALKKYLIKKRYPVNSSIVSAKNIYLPEFIRNDPALIKGRKEFYPKKIFIEKETKDNKISKKIIENLKNAEVNTIDSYKKFVEKRNFVIEDYNKRKDYLFLISERNDLLKSCPCTSGCLSCDYNILNVGFGCPYECTYCFLQEYTNSPGIVLPVNIERHLKKMLDFAGRNKKNKKIRIGTGEFTDSLVFDHITGYSKIISESLHGEDNLIFEFKTKSVNTNNLLNIKPRNNTVISWSLNPESLIKDNEYLTPSFEERITCAYECSEYGYSVGFHFDPIILYEEWKKDYKSIIDIIKNKIDPKKIRWFSLGTFRFKRQLKKIIESRFPENSILDEELLIGFDGKLRYCEDVRIEIYRYIKSLLENISKEIPIYLCMESPQVWSRTGIKINFNW